MHRADRSLPVVETRIQHYTPDHGGGGGAAARTTRNMVRRRPSATVSLKHSSLSALAAVARSSDSMDARGAEPAAA